MLSGLIALCTRAAAAPVLDEDPRDDALADADHADALEDERSGDPRDVGTAIAADSIARARGLRDTLARRDLAGHRPSWWGRLDLAVVWRRTESTDRPPTRELWLVATWRP